MLIELILISTPRFFIVLQIEHKILFTLHLIIIKNTRIDAITKTAERYCFRKGKKRIGKGNILLVENDLLSHYHPLILHTTRCSNHTLFELLLHEIQNELFYIKVYCFVFFALFNLIVITKKRTVTRVGNWILFNKKKRICENIKKFQRLHGIDAK